MLVAGIRKSLRGYIGSNMSAEFVKRQCSRVSESLSFSNQMTSSRPHEDQDTMKMMNTRERESV